MKDKNQTPGDRQTQPVREPGLQNPYRDLTESETKRHSIDIDLKDINLVQTIRPGGGTLNAVTGTMWKKLTDELRKRGISSWEQQEQLERIVNGICFIDARELEQLRIDSANWQSHPIGGGSGSGRRLHDRAARRPVPEVVRQNDGGGAEDPRALHPTAPQQLPNLPGRDGSVRSRKGRKGTASNTDKGETGTESQGTGENQ